MHPRADIEPSEARISNDRLLTGIGCARIAHPESLAIIILLRRAGAERAGPRGDPLGAAERTDAIGPKTDPPGRGNPGGSR